MSKIRDKSLLKPLAAAVGVASFTVSIAMSPVVQADSNPFVMSEQQSGYMLAQNDADHEAHKARKDGEGKCGEGKCGEGKRGEGRKTKCHEGKCGEGKRGEGKRGEGKRGEGKCGEGKCGS